MFSSSTFCQLKSGARKFSLIKCHSAPQLIPDDDDDDENRRRARESRANFRASLGKLASNLPRERSEQCRPTLKQFFTCQLLLFATISLSKLAPEHRVRECKIVSGPCLMCALSTEREAPGARLPANGPRKEWANWASEQQCLSGQQIDWPHATRVEARAKGKRQRTKVFLLIVRPIRFRLSLGRGSRSLARARPPLSRGNSLAVWPIGRKQVVVCGPLVTRSSSSSGRAQTSPSWSAGAGQLRRRRPLSLAAEQRSRAAEALQ